MGSSPDGWVPPDAWLADGYQRVPLAGLSGYPPAALRRLRRPARLAVPEFTGR